MAEIGDTSGPIWVNGYTCNSCSDVVLASRHIDPASATSGPNGVNGESPEKRALRDHFSPEARRTDMLEDMHRQLRIDAANPYAAAYGSAGIGATPGQFVDRTA